MTTKEVNQGAVSSIADTDLVMCCTNGTYHPISFANLMAAVRSGIQVGGRNYLHFKADASVNSKLNADNSVSFISNTDSYFRVKAATDLTSLIGETLTFSMYCEGLAANDVWAFGFGSQSMNMFYLKNGRCSVTFVGNSYTCLQKNGLILVDDISRIVANIGNVKLSKFKLERGNVATDWTPAPEDIASGLWGGVICYLPITYDYTEKGGAHERHEISCGQACVGSDCHLSFGSFNALDQFIGRPEADISLYPVGEASVAERKHLHTKQCKLVHQRSDSVLFNRGYVLGCGCAEGRRSAVIIRYNNGHKSAVRVFLSANKPQEFRRMERSMLPISSGGRTAVVGEYIVTVKPRKEVAV